MRTQFATIPTTIYIFRLAYCTGPNHSQPALARSASINSRDSVVKVEGIYAADRPKICPIKVLRSSRGSAQAHSQPAAQLANSPKPFNLFLECFLSHFSTAFPWTCKPRTRGLIPSPQYPAMPSLFPAFSPRHRKAMVLLRITTRL